MAYLASIAFIPFDRLWLRSRRNKMLGPARTPRDATELIGDLVYMRDVAPARFGRRRGPAAAMVSTQGTLGSTFRPWPPTFWPNVVPMTRVK